MDVRYINPFIAAVKLVFKRMLSTDVLVSKPAVERAKDRVSDVSAIIGYSGDVTGNVSLCFTRSSARSISSKFAGMQLDEESADFADALGELANMVAGQAKSKMDGLNISVSLPKVISGKNHQVLKTNRPVLILPCDSELGRFTIEVIMIVNSGPKGRTNTSPAPVTAAN